jgi:hypothetical protein
MMKHQEVVQHVLFLNPFGTDLPALDVQLVNILINHRKDVCHVQVD